MEELGETRMCIGKILVMLDKRGTFLPSPNLRGQLNVDED